MAKPSLSSFPYRLGLLLGLMLCSSPVAAQQVEPPPDNSPTAPLLEESGSLSPIDANNLFQEGIQLYLQGTAESLRGAIEKWDEAIPLYREFGHREMEAATLNNIGNVYDSLGEKQKALDYYSRALPIFQAVGDRRGEAATLNRIGNVYDSLGEKQKALDYLERALALRQAVGDRAWEARTFNNIGTVYNSLGEKQKALDYLERALALRQAVGDRGGEATTLNNIGSVYSDLGERQKALDYYSRALPIFQATGDRGGEATTLNNFGNVYSDLGERQKALEYLERALALSQAVGDRRGEARTLNNIGNVYSSLGEKQKALDYLERALTLSQAVGDSWGEAAALGNLGEIGNVYSSLGEKQKALDYYESALRLSQSVGDRAGEARTLNKIGYIYSSLGEKQKALDYFFRTLSILQALGYRAGEARTLNNIGSVYSFLGEKQQALDYYESALPILQALGYRGVEAITLQNIGSVYSFLGEKQKALDYYESALPIYQAVGYRRGEAATLVNIGSVYSSLGEKQKALNYYESALPLIQAVGDRGGEAFTLVNIGIVYSSIGEKQKALDYYERALPLTQAVGDRSGEAYTLYNFAILEGSTNNLDKSRTHIEAAIEIIEELRTKIVNQELRTSYFATVQNEYEFYIDLLMELHRENPDRGYEGLALEASERARARSFLELLAEASADIRAGVAPELRDKERSLQQRINATATRQSELLSGKHSPEQAEAIKKELNDLLSELEQVRAQIRQKSPRYADLTQPQPLELKKIQALLDEETLLLEYFLGEERGYLWAVTPTSIAAYELPGREEIEKVARNFRNYLTNPRLRIRRQQVARATAALSDAILKPVSQLLETQKYKRLLIVGDGVLNYIPFAALSLPKAASPQPLIADYEIINLPSASTLATLRRDLLAREPAPKTVAILADPVFNSDDERIFSNASNASNATATEPKNPEIILETIKKAARAAGVEWTRLPGTRLEAKTIMALVAPAQGREMLDFDASQEMAKSPELSQYRILHFATHGFANSENPELSGIVMSLVDERGRQQDGYLRLHDIYNLELNAELTILSACQTGLGQQIRGEGLIGLTRGFMYAGTPRVVASLWNVDDRATAELMGIFYQKMLRENMAPAAALRAAQLEISQQKEWQMPYYWAAFGLQGEWR